MYYFKLLNLAILYTHTHPLTQSPSSPPPHPAASDDVSEVWYSAPEEQEELVEHYPTSLSPQTVPGPHTHPVSSHSPPTRPGDLTSTDESGSLCPTVESPVRLELHGGKCKELECVIVFNIVCKLL